MSIFNQVFLLARLGKTPELVTTPGGKSVCSVSMATTEGYKDQSGNWKEVAEWHNVVFFGSVAEVLCKHSGKGDLLLIHGRLRTRQYTDSAKNERYVTEVIVNEFSFASRSTANVRES